MNTATAIPSELTLSEEPHVLRREDATTAARIEDLLELRHRARILSYRDLEAAYTDRLIDEVWSDTFGLNGPGGHAA